MATSILLRSARSFLGSKNMLPAAGATACTAIPLGQRLGTVARLFSSKPPNSASTLESPLEDMHHAMSLKRIEDKNTFQEDRSDLSVQSAQGSKDVATRCLPAAGATACTADDDLTDDQILALRQALISPGRKNSSNLNGDSTLTVEEYHEAFELTDDIVNSEDKLHALFSKWLLYNKPHFDIEDEKAFKKRFEIFKDNARRIHEYNNSCHHSACGINSSADMTLEEHLDGMCGSHPMEAFEEELEGMGGSNPLETFEEHLDGMCWSHPMKAIQVTAGIASMYGGSV